MADVLLHEDIGQGFTVEQLQYEDGHTYYRICTSGTCRYAEDYWMVMMYAESMGWLPPHRQHH